MKRADMVRLNAQQLFLTEEMLDKTLCECAKLAQILGENRMASGLSAVVGQEAIDGIAVLYKRLSRARRDLVDLHKVLDEVKTQIGARTVMVGFDDGKPQPPPKARIIEVVNSEAA